MSKNISKAKSTKALSKVNLGKAEHDAELIKKQLTHFLSIQITRLQRMIIEQNYERIQSQNNIKSQIHNLEQTKKSKLPSKPDPSNLSKLFSPNKPRKENEQPMEICQYKNLLTSIKSERQLETCSNKKKIELIQNQIAKINNRIGQISTIQQNAKQLKSQVNEIRQLINNQNYLSRVQNCQITIQSLKQQLTLVPKLIQSHINENKNELKSFIDSILSRQQDFTEIINSQQIKMEQITFFITKCAKALEKVENSAITAFDSLEQKIKIANESIIETKSTIQQTFYGSDYKWKDKFQSQSSLDCTPESITHIPRRLSQRGQKLNYFEKRIEGLERRVSLVYDQYISKSFEKDKFETIPLLK